MNKVEQSLNKFVKTNLLDNDDLIINNNILYTIDSNMLKENNKQILYTRQFIEKNHQKKLYNIMYEEIRAISQKANELDIKVIFLKGLVLAKDLYTPIENRISSDIDILIDIKNISLIMNMLNELGFKRERPFNIHINHIELYKYIDNIILTIEIHGSIVNPPNFFRDNTKDFITRAVNKRILDFNTYVLDLHDNIIFLVLHFIKHLPLDYFDNILLGRPHRFNMQNIHDIALFIQKYKNMISWDKIRCMSVDMNICGYVYLVYRIINGIYSNLIPLNAINEIYNLRMNTWINENKFNENYHITWRFLWFFNIVYDDFCNLPIENIVRGQIDDVIKLNDFINRDTNYLIYHQLNSNSITLRKFCIDINDTEQDGYHISGKLSINDKSLTLELEDLNRSFWFYKGDVFLWNVYRIELMYILSNKVRAFKIVPQINHNHKPVVEVYDYNCSSLRTYCEDEDFSFNLIDYGDKGYKLSLDIKWLELGIDLYPGMELPFNIAINYYDLSNINTKKKKLFGDNELWWDFRDIGNLYIT